MELNARKINFTGIATYLALALLAVLFYKERMILFDDAYHTFEIIRTRSLAIQGNRFGAAVTQVWPLLAVLLNLPLKAVLIIYSLSFVLYPFLVFLISLRYFRSPQIALCTLLFSVLLTAHTFYWLISEFVQGCFLVMLFYGFLLHKGKTRHIHPLELVLVTGLIVTIAFFHPLMAVPFFYLGVFFFFSEKSISTRLIALAFITFIAVLLFKKYFIPVSSYDASKMETLRYFKTLFPDYFRLKVNYLFLKNCVRHYYFLLPLLLICSVVYLKGKNYVKLLLLLSFFAGFLLLVNITGHLWPDPFYMEASYQCLGLFVIFPFVFDVLPLFKSPKVAYACISGIVLIRVAHIGLSHQPYTERLAWNERLLEETGKGHSKKLIIHSQSVPMEVLRTTWASSYELLLLSSLEKPENARCLIIDDDPASLAWAIGDTKAFISKWGAFPFSNLPKNYFCPRDTSSYKLIPDAAQYR